MESPELNTPALAVLAAAGLASLAVLFRLFEVHISRRPLLELEPRRPVPWNFVAPLIIFAPAILNFAIGLIAEPPVQSVPERVATAAAFHVASTAASPAAAYTASRASAAAFDLAEENLAAEAAAPMILVGGVALLGMVVLGVVVLAKVFGANVHDLGLPTSWPQLGRDVRIGAAAFAASLAPIYALMYLLTMLLEPTEGHPLIEQYTAHPSLGLMIAAAVTAVIVAPIAEEVSFRMVFQGWLERLATERSSTSITASAAIGGGSFNQNSPGWGPIVVSSVVFGLAHWGHGVAPLPLILLGAILGYVYQRTHRLAPGIVCHMLFNGLTLLMLWLQIGT
jgi:membrane protease YdiL (CAAX protease family)